MKIKAFTVMLFLLPVVAFGQINPSNGVIHVNETGVIDGDGSTFEKAVTLQAALDFINNNMHVINPYQIWMQHGEYSIRDKAFRIACSTALYGGFSGTENNISSRPSGENALKTILTRDAESPEDRILIIAKNPDHLITVDIDGITITGGVAHQEVDDYALSSTSAYRGGGIFIGNADVTFQNVSITQNIANATAVSETSRGGGIYAIKSKLLFKNCDISFNTAKAVEDLTPNGYSGTGGGLYNYETQVEFINSSFEGNIAAQGVAKGFGGAVYHCSGNFLIENSFITHNYATAGYAEEGFGGGIYAEQGSSGFVIRNTDITGNYANASSLQGIGKGGGIYSYNRPFQIINSTFAENVAHYGSSEGWGGGLHINSGTREFNIINTLFYDNIAQKGGAVCVEKGTNINMINLTISANDGGGLYMMSSTKAKLYNSILWNNSGNDFDFESGVETVRICSLIRGYKNTEDPIEILDGTNDQYQENYPQFADPDNQNYRLAFGSPLRLMGDGSYNTESEDRDNNPRQTDGNIDLGAYQYTPYQVTLSSPVGFRYILDPTGNYYKKSDLEYEVGYGQTFVFKTERLSGYDGTARVKVNDNIIQPQNGLYSFELKGDSHIEVTGFSRLPDPTPVYPVTMEVIGEGELKVMYQSYFELKNGDYMDEGSQFTVHATPAEGYLLDQITVNNNEIENGGKYRITEATHVYVLFVKESSDPDPDPGPVANEKLDSSTEIWSASGNLYIKTTKKTLLRVISITGKTVLNQSFDTGESVIPLPKGVYIYVIDNAKPGKIIIRN